MPGGRRTDHPRGSPGHRSPDPSFRRSQVTRTALAAGQRRNSSATGTTQYWRIQQLLGGWPCFPGVYSESV